MLAGKFNQAEDRFARDKSRNGLSRISLLCATLALVLSACSSEQPAPIAEVLSIDGLGTEATASECRFSRYEERLKELITDHPEKAYDLALSSRLYPEGSEAITLMRSRSVHDRFLRGQEAMVLLPNTGRNVILARFPNGLDAEQSALVQIECAASQNGNCYPLLYFDGEEAFCLGTTQEDYARERSGG